jgi:hypothetical protein
MLAKNDRIEEEEGDIYTEEGSALVLEDDEISPQEEAFMHGYLSS